MGTLEPDVSEQAVLLHDSSYFGQERVDMGGTGEAVEASEDEQLKARRESHRAASVREKEAAVEVVATSPTPRQQRLDQQQHTDGRPFRA